MPHRPVAAALTPLLGFALIVAIAGTAGFLWRRRVVASRQITSANSHRARDPALSSAAALAALEQAAGFYWIVDGDAGPKCQRWNVEQASRPFGFSAYLVQDTPADSGHLPIRLKVRHDGRRVSVMWPQVWYT
jgi:hypothetical protein